MEEKWEWQSRSALLLIRHIGIVKECNKEVSGDRFLKVPVELNHMFFFENQKQEP